MIVTNLPASGWWLSDEVVSCNVSELLINSWMLIFQPWKIPVYVKICIFTKIFGDPFVMFALCCAFLCLAGIHRHFGEKLSVFCFFYVWQQLETGFSSWVIDNKFYPYESIFIHKCPNQTVDSYDARTGAGNAELHQDRSSLMRTQFVHF